MSLLHEHDDRGISNAEVAWVVYFAFVIGLLVVLLVIPAVIA